jgi:hypothetical protein
MKKLIPLLIVGMVVLGGLGAVAQPVTEQPLDRTALRFSEPILQNENTYVSLTMDDTNSFLMQQGKPMLPSYTKTFTYPFGTKITGVTVTPQNIQTLTITTQLKPTPRQVVLGQEETATMKETTDYGTEPYPSAWFDYRVGCGRYDGELSIIVNVEVYPVRYHPAHNIVEWAQNVDVAVNYEPAAPQPSPSSRDTYEFIVIAPSEYTSQLSSLITHKINRGITTKYVTLDDIYGGTYFPANGRDNQERIKYFIKNAIESWTTAFVLLVGSASKLPVRETHVNVDDDYEVMVSDLYYADIYNKTGGFSSWDTNGNSIFGEFNWQTRTDSVDLHPDVYLARLAATTTSQVTNSVNKIIAYETTPGYQQSWFQNLVLVGGDSFEDDDAINEGEYSNQKVDDIMVGFNPIPLNVTNGALTGYTPTGVAAIQNTINDGCGFVDFSGHGNTNVWATHPHLNFNSWVPTPTQGILTMNVQQLTNGNKLPIVTVEACSTAKFNEDPNCFNWAFVYNGNGGAIGSFGCTGLGYGYIGTGVTTGLIGKIGLDTYRAFLLDQATTFGEMWGRALERYIKTSMQDGDYKTVEEWQAFGDPTLAIADESQPPVKPSTPSGPTAGKVGTEYTYTTSTTDPETDKISYMFDWGDGTLSGWVGPLNSGSTATAKKTWTTKGTFRIKTIAKDTHGKYSEWSDSLTVVVTGSSIVIQNVQGGLFKITAQIKNTGDDPVSNVNWNITLSGGAVIGAKSSGTYTSSIPVNGVATIQSSFILGLGATSIKINAWISDGPKAAAQKSGVILLFYIKLNE